MSARQPHNSKNIQENHTLEYNSDEDYTTNKSKSQHIGRYVKLK